MEPFVTEERYARSIARALWTTPRQLVEQRAWRVGPGDERRLKFFFHTNTESKAQAMSTELRRRGHESKPHATGALVAWTGTWLEQASWAVSGLSPPVQMAQDTLLGWANGMCELGLLHDCEFEGWFCQTPLCLEESEDHALTGRPDGTLDLEIRRWSATSEAALAENDVYWVSPGAQVGRLTVMQHHAGKIRGLRSPDESLSLEDIDTLSGLEQIYLWRDPRAHGDYRKLPQLRGLRCLDAEKLNPAWLNNPSLRTVELRRPRKLKSLSTLDAWQSLASLALVGAPLTSLEGLGKFQGLRELRMANSLSLRDLGELGQLPRVERLEIHKAPKVGSFEPLAGLTGLRWVFVGDRQGTLSGYDLVHHWPQLQNASVLMRVGRVDFDALAQHPTAAAFVLYTNAGTVLPDETALRQMLQQHGRRVRSVVLRPKDVCPCVEVTFESPYWRSPAEHEGHRRTVVD